MKTVYVCHFDGEKSESESSMERICLPKQETQVQSLGRENLLEKNMATHSSILAWEIPWTEESGGRQSMGSKKVSHDLVTNFHFTFFSSIHKVYECPDSVVKCGILLLGQVKIEKNLIYSIPCCLVAEVCLTLLGP